MAFNQKAFEKIKKDLEPYKAKLVAVSKKKPASDILEAIQAGQFNFGENYVQELCDKREEVKSKGRWHFIGHLQSNKVKNIAPFIHLIQSVDSVKLLNEINKEARKSDRIIDCLLQVHIAAEETKFGFNEQEAEALMLYPELSEMENIRIRGLMGMASLTNDEEQIKKEFTSLHYLFTNCRLMSMDPEGFDTLSMGMSSDYKIALDCGSNMIRIGSMLFGERDVR
ncbi:MAG: YggS family pyridoxal phosphate-dependent enzyme [Bacteroidetes bacterium]|jgi:pyridoxal phosphate enzyme (YggS family)|nr:YggS family pyridoxal phosphate-dependent enzyme [Bacteroidota bacterium]MBK9401566.1 YggS family pyridoxal phosphate-dependent enzyme [Bacteroidota bacterium]